MKKISNTIKGSLIGLTLVQSLTSQAYFDKKQYLNENAHQFNSTGTRNIRKNLIEKSTEEMPKSSIETILDRVTATINKDARTYGPIYRHDSRDVDKYGDDVVKIILKAAHKRAKKYLDEGNADAYYAFLILALTVPNQEGLFVHFREIDANRDNCNDDRTNGKNIKSSRAQKNFKMALNAKISKDTFFGERLKDDPSRIPFLVRCKELKGEGSYKQLIAGGSDGSDVGMFQLSSLWHYDGYLKKGQYDSVKQTVEYGIKYLFMGEGGRGFRSIVNKNPACVQKEDSSIDYTKVIRGTWSAYNGGPDKYCRFADENGVFAGHDKGFKSNLQITLNLNDGGFFGFQEDSALQLSPNVRAAVEEVVTNFEKHTNHNSALKALINKR